MRKFVLSVLVSIIMAIGLVSARPLVISASTAGNQVGFTNNSSYLGTLKLFRYETQAIYPSTGGQYTYAYYFQTDPGLYGVISGRMNDSTSELFSVAIQNGISEVFYSNQLSAYVYSVQLVEYDQTLPQEVIDYIANIDSNVELTTDLVDKLVNFRQWNIPYESWSLVYSALRYGLPEDNYSNGYNMNFPIFRQTQGNILVRLNMNKNNQYVLIAGMRSADVSSFNSQYQLVDDNGNSGWTISKYETLQTIFLPFNNSTSYVYISKITFTCNTSENYKLIPNTSNLPFIPIYFNLIQNNLLSTDFSLIFGLSNRLLDDLHVIAQGTQQSNSSSSDLEDSANEYGELADDVLGLEDDLGSGFSSSLNNVPTTFNFSTQFGNKFLHSATWVRNQFETLTTNTPFGALITFSLVLGLALLLVGRRLL